MVEIAHEILEKFSSRVFLPGLLSLFKWHTCACATIFVVMSQTEAYKNAIKTKILLHKSITVIYHAIFMSKQNEKRNLSVYRIPEILIIIWVKCWKHHINQQIVNLFLVQLFAFYFFLPYLFQFPFFFDKKIL